MRINFSDIIIWINWVLLNTTSHLSYISKPALNELENYWIWLSFYSHYYFLSQFDVLVALDLVLCVLWINDYNISSRQRKRFNTCFYYLPEYVLAIRVVITSLKIYLLHKLATFNAVLLRYYVNRSDFIPGSRVLKTQILNGRHSKNDTYSCRVPKI